MVTAHRRPSLRRGTPLALVLVVALTLVCILTLGGNILRQSQQAIVAHLNGVTTAGAGNSGTGTGGGGNGSDSGGGGNGSDSGHRSGLAGRGSSGAQPEQPCSNASQPPELASGPNAAVAAAAAAGLLRQAIKLGPASSRWAPWVLPRCLPGMPGHWAPCRVGAAGESSNLVYGEELVYPDFSVPHPLFLTEEHAKWWRAQVHPDRYQLLGGRAYFRSWRGQNLLFQNMTYKGTPSSSWADDACMAFGVSHRALEPLPPGTEPQLGLRAVLANTPDSWSLQHFLDRVTKVLVQTEPWRVAGPSSQRYQLRTGAPSSAFAQSILMAVLGPEGEVAPMGEFSAAELLFPCRTPLTHPYFHERLWEVLALPPVTPLKERKLVLYLSRSHGGANNGGRQVTNEDAVLEAIRGVLVERGRGEELVMFDPTKFAQVHDLAAFFFSNVSAVVGPHGGAWYNYMFLSAPDTLGLEFLPMGRFGVLVWEEASMRGRPVTVLPVPSANGQHDMEVEPELVARALREQLGKSQQVQEPQQSYTWDLVQLSR